eukprot:TRINITY_DN4719_c0_g1_i13.p1 TRINITY_DN4719_c0_g1~~TRINITY_DN4719_c0_g1_i13.p1  ORF type:complete len:342 (-),score=72.10 TRINITY_DN4719_c0_g1_i13:52-1077(-)
MNEKKMNSLLRKGSQTSTKSKLNPLITIISYIVNHNIVNPVLYSILLLIQLLQMLSTALDSFENIDSQFEYFVDVIKKLSYFHVVVKASSSLWVLVITCFHCFFLFMVLLCIFLLLVIGKTNKKKLIAFLSTLLNTMLTFGITVLLIPLIKSFLFSLLCYNDKVFTPSYMPCGGGVQITLSVIGVVLALIVVVFDYIIARMITDDYWLSTLAWAGEGIEPHMLNEIFKLSVALYSGIDINGDYTYVAIIILFFIDLIMIYKRITCDVPYSKLVFVMKAFSESILLVFFIYGILELTIDINIDMIITFFMFVISICLTIAIILISNARRSACLLYTSDAADE